MKKVKKRDSNGSIMSILEQRQSISVLKNLSSKQNMILKINSRDSLNKNNNQIFSYKSS